MSCCHDMAKDAAAAVPVVRSLPLFLRSFAGGAAPLVAYSMLSTCCRHAVDLCEVRRRMPGVARPTKWGLTSFGTFSAGSGKPDGLKNHFDIKLVRLKRCFSPKVSEIESHRLEFLFGELVTRTGEPQENRFRNSRSIFIFANTLMTQESIHVRFKGVPMKYCYLDCRHCLATKF